MNRFWRFIRINNIRHNLDILILIDSDYLIGGICQAPHAVNVCKTADLRRDIIIQNLNRADGFDKIVPLRILISKTLTGIEPHGAERAGNSQRLRARLGSRKRLRLEPNKRISRTHGG